MLMLGLALFGFCVAYLVWRFLTGGRSRGLNRRLYVGLVVIAGATVLLGLDVWLASVFLTPIIWTGYILVLDSAARSIRGRSLLTSGGGAVGWMALLSVGLWMIFEAYNLRLQNWEYTGLPHNAPVRTFGYLWSFATIWPAVLVTADFLLATQFREGERARPLTPPRTALLIAGASLVIIPAVVPARASSYLFGMVWIGFGLLLDPLNDRAGRPSLLADLRQGDRRRVWALLVAGAICGVVWEFWNYWAAARWIYVFPIGQKAKIFEMPVPGYLGFPAFAIEVFAMYVYVTGLLRVPYYEVR